MADNAELHATLGQVMDALQKLNVGLAEMSAAGGTISQRHGILHENVRQLATAVDGLRSLMVGVSAANAVMLTLLIKHSDLNADSMADALEQHISVAAIGQNKEAMSLLRQFLRVLRGESSTPPEPPGAKRPHLTCVK